MNTVSIEYGEKHDVTAVVCEHDDGEPTIILPFGGERINSVAAIDADRVAALGAEGNLAIHHQRSGALLASGKGALKSGALLVCAKHLLIHSYNRISSWSVDPLREVWWANCIIDYGNGPQLAIWDAVRERIGADGIDAMRAVGTLLPLAVGSSATVLANCRAFLPMNVIHDKFNTVTGRFEGRTCSYGYCIVNAETAEIEAATVEHTERDKPASGFLAVSPSGNYALRYHFGEIPYSSGRVLPRLLSFLQRRELAGGHRDAVKDGRERFGIMLELWRLGSMPVLDRRLVVRMIEPRHVDTGRIAAGNPGHDASTFRALRRRLRGSATQEPTKDEKLVLRQLGETVSAVTWEPDGSAFWIEFRNAILRRVSLDGTISPLLVFRRWQPGADPLNCRPGMFTFGGRFEFMPDGRVRFRRRFRGSGDAGSVTLNPALVERPDGVIIVEPEEDAFQQEPSFGKAIDKLVRGKAYVQQKVRLLSEAHVNIALLELAAKLDGNVGTLCWGDLLRFRFTCAGKGLKEKDLFALMVASNWRGAVPGLKALLTAYLGSIKGGEGHQPWYDGEGGIAALAYALRAQLFLDPDDFSLWWKYLDKRDDEHERYMFDRLLPEYVERFGWRGEPGLRFGIDVAMFEHFKGETQPWSNHGLIDAAERLVGPDRFADMLFEAAQGFGFTSPVSQYLLRLISLLDQSQPYQAAVTAAVSRKIASAPPRS